MKITDFALIFVAVTLPIIIIVYVNVSFTIKATEQEMYYKKIIDMAIADATSQMKEVESDDPEIDYGYSGEEDKKISINAKIALDSFFNSLYNNFNILGNTAVQTYLQHFVPVVAVLDYNGVYISSLETYKNAKNEEVVEHVLKPKRYYSYTYNIYRSGDKYEIVDASTDTKTNPTTTHTVEFTMDDYITHRGVDKNGNEIPTKSFYISDSRNNYELVGDLINTDLKEKVVKHLQEKRKEIIIDTILREISYATNAANFYAKNAGITYDFVFPQTTQDEMENAIENVGVFAFVQGLSIGNRYLNSKAYGTTKLELVSRYYFSLYSNDSKYKLNLYHKDKECLEFKIADTVDITPAYVTTKQQAASAKISKKDGKGRYIPKQGFYPCQICRP